MLVDVFNRLHETKSTFRALLQAGQERMRPIVMTTLTTVLGLMPLLFEKGDAGSLWKPMAVTIVGGLTVSTILVLFVIPVFYLILQDMIKGVRRKFAVLGAKQ
jgi:HAE1 family hydrophobic/amphiphilic exporter-1